MADADSVSELLKRSGADNIATFGMLDWTHDRELLTLIVDVLNQMHATLVQVNSSDGKRPAVEPMRRPVTVLDKIEAQQNIEDHRERVAKFLPKG